MEKGLILIVEDNVVVAKSIESMLVKRGWVVVGMCRTGEDALKVVKSTPPDLIIMDIQLEGEMDGIQTAAMIKEHLDIPLIYLTEHSDVQHVRRASQTMPVNYLDKPFTEAELTRAISIAIYNANMARAKQSTEDPYIFLRTSPGHYVRLEYRNILFLEAERSYCKVQAVDQAYTVSTNMASIHEQLDQSRFIRIHRSFIVNITRVKEFNGTDVTVGAHRLPVGEQYKTEMMKKLKIVH